MKNKTTAGITSKAKKIALIAMDVDGVLTAGELIILGSGEEIKVWNVKDRFGYHLLRRSGLNIKLAWITARESAEVKRRAEDLKIEFVYQKCSDKAGAVADIMLKEGLAAENIAFIGDDWVDIPALKKVGLAVCPKDSPPEVIRHADYVSRFEGGRGVLRELIELVITAQGAYEKTAGLYEI